MKNPSGDADIIALTNYHEFGMAMRLRSFANYRYGYQGSEKESGVAGMYTTDFRMLDVRIGRWFIPDPIFDPSKSSYNSMDNNPIFYNDRTGEDAKVTIVGNTVVISVKIFIYGSGASNAIASKFESAIMNDWNNSGNGWKYEDKSSGQDYTVIFDVSVELYDKENPTNDNFILDRYNPASRNNYIKVGATEEEVIISATYKGDEGYWRGYGSNPAPHEFGHLIGLKDRYDRITKKPNKNWEGNIMAERAGQGVVQQKNINAIMTPIIKEYSTFENYLLSSMTGMWRGKIDENHAGWESSDTGSHDR